jgi:hypothetical protein
LVDLGQLFREERRPAADTLVWWIHDAVVGARERGAFVARPSVCRPAGERLDGLERPVAFVEATPSRGAFALVLKGLG